MKNGFFREFFEKQGLQLILTLGAVAIVIIAAFTALTLAPLNSRLDNVQAEVKQIEQNQIGIANNQDAIQVNQIQIKANQTDIMNLQKTVERIENKVDQLLLK